MIRVRVTNNQGVLTNQSKFETQLEADAWVASQIPLNSFGKPERWIHEDDLAALGESKQNAIASQLTGSPDDEKSVYKFPAEYTVTFEDVTAEYQQISRNNEAINYLNSTDWMVIRAMEHPDQPVPLDVATARATARLSIIKL